MRTQIEMAYAPADDLTFIMEYTYNGDILVKIDCVGWYHGTPCQTATEIFYGHLSAEL